MDAKWINQRFRFTDPRLSEAKRDVTSAPHSLELDGARWLVGTDGKLGVAVRSDADAPPFSEDNAGVMRDALYLRGEPVELRTADLREWAGPVAWRAVVECDECDGSGTSDGECECHCGNIHEAVCGECEGLGYAITGDDVRYGRVMDTIINKTFVARLMEGVTDDSVLVYSTETQLRLRNANDSWRAVIMGMRDLGRTNIDVFPAPLTSTGASHDPR